MSEDKPHMASVFRCRRLDHIFLSEERLAFRFGDLAFEPFRSTFPLPVRLCIVAVLPDDLKLSRKMSRANIKMKTYPQAGGFAVDKLAEKCGAQTNTASTLCMKAVRSTGGEGERRRVPPGRDAFRHHCR
ncbi:MAG TPA: hypothetical protein VGN36_03830 [Sphingorhabdus sp.]|jgi:hypothetical protein|nr:hypothetical protein [Sphingorhabdus sp.]